MTPPPLGTIRPMKIRSVTLGNNITWPLSAGEFAKAGRFVSRAQALFSEAGIEVQTVRLATQPLREMSASPLDLWPRLDTACAESGIGNCAVGPGPLDSGLLADLIAATKNVFVSTSVAMGGAIDFAAIKTSAAVMHRVACSTDLGFGNLRFAAAAHCGPNIP